VRARWQSCRRPELKFTALKAPRLVCPQEPLLWSLHWHQRCVGVARRVCVCVCVCLVCYTVERGWVRGHAVQTVTGDLCSYIFRLLLFGARRCAAQPQGPRGAKVLLGKLKDVSPDLAKAINGTQGGAVPLAEIEQCKWGPPAPPLPTPTVPAGPAAATGGGREGSRSRARPRRRQRRHYDSDEEYGAGGADWNSDEDESDDDGSSYVEEDEAATTSSVATVVDGGGVDVEEAMEDEAATVTTTVATVVDGALPRAAGRWHNGVVVLHDASKLAHESVRLLVDALELAVGDDTLRAALRQLVEVQLQGADDTAAFGRVLEIPAGRKAFLCWADAVATAALACVAAGVRHVVLIGDGAPPAFKTSRRAYVGVRGGGEGCYFPALNVRVSWGLCVPQQG
jgi:hypothetical protein